MIWYDTGDKADAHLPLEGGEEVWGRSWTSTDILTPLSPVGAKKLYLLVSTSTVNLPVIHNRTSTSKFSDASQVR